MTDAERDRLIAEIRTDVALIKQRLDVLTDHENRIRGLERFRYAVPSVSVLALGISTIGAVLAITGS